MLTDCFLLAFSHHHISSIHLIHHFDQSSQMSLMTLCCACFYVFSLRAQVRYSCAKYINTYIHIYIYLNSYFFSSDCLIPALNFDMCTENKSKYRKYNLVFSSLQTFIMFIVLCFMYSATLHFLFFIHNYDILNKL